MKKVVNKTVNLDLTQVNANAFAIMGAFQRQARREGWSQQQINRVLKQAKSKDYNYLLGVIENHCEPLDTHKDEQ